MSKKKKNINEHITDETLVKVGSNLIWLWDITNEPKDKEILSVYKSKERNMFVAKDKFIAGLIKIYDRHSLVSTERGHLVSTRLYTDS